MKSNSTILENRLLKYSLVAGGALLVFSDTHAEVKKTTLAPAVVNSGNSYNIDFDQIGGDGNDITIKVGWSTVGVMGFSFAENEASFAGPFSLRRVHPKVYNFGTSINAGLSWNLLTAANGSNYLTSMSSSGYWNGNPTNKYLPVKFDISGSTHYGYVEMSINSSNMTTTIHSFAYNDVAGQPLQAGALPVELTSFTTMLLDDGVKLLWETATEIDNYGFDIQRSVASNQFSEKEWKTVGFVEGHGNSNSPKSYEFTDNSLVEGGEYVFRLKQIDADGGFEYSDEVKVTIGTPDKFALKQNYPNPFNPTTNIKFILPESGMVNLTIYNTLGQEVAVLLNQQMEAGNYEKEFNAEGLPSGTYLYKIVAGNFIESRKMMVLK